MPEMILKPNIFSKVKKKIIIMMEAQCTLRMVCYHKKTFELKREGTKFYFS